MDILANTYFDRLKNHTDTRERYLCRWIEEFYGHKMCDIGKTYHYQLLQLAEEFLTVAQAQQDKIAKMDELLNDIIQHNMPSPNAETI